MTGILHERLRLATLAHLGAFAPELAREALERGVVEVEHDVLSWDGSHGQVHAHKVRLGLDPDLLAKIVAAPSVLDALTAAFAGAVPANADPAEVGVAHALAELELFARTDSGRTRARSPYRGNL